MQALLGAKNPHPQTFLVGGMSIPKEVTDGVLKKLQVGPEALFSTLGRTAARGIETLVTAEMLPVWIYELAARIKSGDFLIHSGEKWEPSTWPKEAKGYGFHEAPRGSLCHWVVIKNGVVANYQCVVPGGWNSSPRDGKGQRGPYEEALRGTPLSDPNRPLEISIPSIHAWPVPFMWGPRRLCHS
jgi:Ni,Fe-hydrogenase I large subunit